MKSRRIAAVPKPDAGSTPRIVAHRAAMTKSSKTAMCSLSALRDGWFSGRTLYRVREGHRTVDCRRMLRSILCSVAGCSPYRLYAHATGRETITRTAPAAGNRSRDGFVRTAQGGVRRRERSSLPSTVGLDLHRCLRLHRKCDELRDLQMLGTAPTARSLAHTSRVFPLGLRILAADRRMIASLLGGCRDMGIGSRVDRSAPW